MPSSEFAWCGAMTRDEIEVVAHSAFPDAQVEADNEGQWIVYTNIRTLEEAHLPDFLV